MTAPWALRAQWTRWCAAASGKITTRQFWPAGRLPCCGRFPGRQQGEGTPCQVSLEERMACGIGACLTCSCKVNGHYKRACKDGPVFLSQEVEWDA